MISLLTGRILNVWPLALASSVSLLGLGCQSRVDSAQDAAPESPTAVTPVTPAKPAVRKEFSFTQLEHKLVADQPQKLQFKLEPGAGLKINPEYPWKVVLEPAEGVKLKSESLTRESLDLNAERALINLDVDAVSPGEHTVMASVNLSVCERGGQKRCLWFTQEPVELKLSAAADAAAPSP